MRLFLIGIAIAQFSMVGVIAQSLASRVLVVYNASNADSVSVAQHYRTVRRIPTTNLCAINPAKTTGLSREQFETSVRGPVQACLNALGRQSILYVVFSSQTPYKIWIPHQMSLDSAIADIWDENATVFADDQEVPTNYHPYYAAAQSRGNVYAPFQPLSAFRAQAGAKTIYSVWRLDAATPALAKALVDRAIQAESIGLAGTACFDRNRGSDMTRMADVGYLTGDWDIRKAADAAREAGYPTVEDPHEQEFGTAPAPPRCDGAALYAGWYSYNNYPDVFSWNPGAIGFHVDSASALDPRGGTNWTANSVARGITITSGAVAEPYLQGVVHSDGFFRNLFEGANVGDAMLRNTQWLKWMNLNTGDPLYRPFPSGRAPFNSRVNENGLRIEPMRVLGGEPVLGTVYLDAAAPTGGAVVALTSSSANATTPTSVMVPAGATSASFSIATTRPTDTTATSIQATYDGVVRRNSLEVTPLLGSFTLRPTANVVGGATVEATVWLNGTAPAGGTLVVLESTDAAVAPVPANVTVPAGMDHVKFSVVTGAVATAMVPIIKAAHANTTRTATLTVRAATLSSLTLAPTSLIAGLSSEGTVTLTGPAPPGGVKIALENLSAFTSSAAQVAIPAGARSATFPLSTPIVDTTTTASVRAIFNGVSKTAAVKLYPPITSVSTSPSPQAMGGGNATLKVVIPFAAPSGGSAISLRSSNLTVAPVAATVIMPAGSSSLNVTIPTNSQATPTGVTLTATLGGYSRSVTLSVVPVLISSIAPPATITSGTTGSGTVTLAAVAAAGGATIRLSSSNPSAATVPSSVTVPAGATRASFVVTALQVTANMPVTITATCLHNSKMGMTTVSP